MKVYFRLMATMIALVFLLIGCNSSIDPTERLDDLNIPTDPLGDLNIPDNLYSQYFSTVEGATLYVDGVPRQIAADDPRLVRVLNLLAYASESNQLSRTQGVIHEEQINQYYSSEATMLEVTFAADSASGGSGFRNTPKILICGDTYLLFMNPETYYTEEPCAERHWPFVNLAPEGARRSSEDLSWGEEYWLDLLAYCGFAEA